MIPICWLLLDLYSLHRTHFIIKIKFCCCNRVVELKKHKKKLFYIFLLPHDCIENQSAVWLSCVLCLVIVLAICNNCFDIIAREIIWSVANVFLPWCIIKIICFSAFTTFYDIYDVYLRWSCVISFFFSRETCTERFCVQI